MSKLGGYATNCLFPCGCADESMSPQARASPGGGRSRRSSYRSSCWSSDSAVMQAGRRSGIDPSRSVPRGWRACVPLRRAPASARAARVTAYPWVGVWSSCCPQASVHMGTSARRCAAAQPWRRQRRTAAAGHCTLTLITRTRDPLERSISACEQISSSMSVTSISVVGRHCKVLGISPGQMRHAEPSLSSDGSYRVS